MSDTATVAASEVAPQPVINFFGMGMFAGSLMSISKGKATAMLNGKMVKRVDYDIRILVQLTNSSATLTLEDDTVVTITTPQMQMLVVDVEKNIFTIPSQEEGGPNLTLIVQNVQ